MGESSEPLILSIDTATQQRGVAVTRGGRVLSVVRGDARLSGSSSVLGDVDAALHQAEVELADVELFAVASGPGSFTGLRAGLATAKAFARTLGRPVVGVPTLHAVAHSGGASERTVAFIPAGRGELFAQALSVSPEGEVRALEMPSHVAPSALIERAARAPASVKWVGVDAGVFGGLLKAAAERAGVDFQEGGGADESRGRPMWMHLPAVRDLTGHVAALALKKYLKGESSDAEDVRAIYVRASDAELKERCRAPE